MTASTTDLAFCTAAKQVIEIERDAINSLLPRIGNTFERACEAILACQGRVIVTGMGKSGHIGNKIASTLASTGTPAFFVHPGEASHGDMGMVTAQDVVMAISNSGQTPELIKLLPAIKRLGAKIIALTGKPNALLAQSADIHLDVSIQKEACPLGLAPTSSTTATLVMGDAIAVALLEARGFTADDFALFHPGGALGKKLLLFVDDIMTTGEAMPTVSPTCTVKDALIEITQKRLGMTTVVDTERRLVGIFTDGDLRRVLDKNLPLNETRMQTVMTAQCKTIAPNTLAASALKQMNDLKITSLVVINAQRQPLGIIHVHDILKNGVS